MSSLVQTRDSYIRVTWMSHVTHLSEHFHTHEWMIFHIWTGISFHTHQWVVSQVWMSQVTNVISSRTWSKSAGGLMHALRMQIHINICMILLIHTQDTGWRILIAYLKLQVIFRQRATNSRALLRKMTYEDKASYESTPPCRSVWSTGVLSMCELSTRVLIYSRSSKYIYIF